MISRMPLLLLAALLMITACSSQTQLPEETAQSDPTAAVQTETVGPSEQEQYIQALPEADFGGEAFTILAVPDDIAWGTVSYDAEAEVGEVLNDFVYNRNREIEERYHITIDVVNKPDIAAAVKSMVSSGSDEYDMISDYVKMIMSNASGGYYYNLHNVEGLNFEHPWWDYPCTELMTLEDRLFVAFSDMNTQPTAMLSCLLVNFDMVSQFDLGSLYDIVRDGTWTMDLMHSMCRETAGDINGDGKMDENDRYGAYLGIGTVSAALNGQKQYHVMRREDGSMVLNTGSAGLIAAAEKFAEVFNDRNLTVYINEHEPRWDSFSEGRALFGEGEIGNLTKYRDAEMHVGIIPYPKFDEAQDTYYTMMSNCSMGVSMPTTAQDPARSALIIEALGAYSYIDLRHAYYDVTLKDKLAHDENTPQMLDIIIDSKRVDLGVIYEVTLGDVITSVLHSIQKNGAGELASLAKKNQTKFESAYEKILEQYASLD